MRTIPPASPVLLEPGFRFDGYELLCKIGQGGMASVWLARYSHADDPHSLVAIKTILPELAANKEFRAMMLDEARIVTKITHPSVAATLKVGQLWDIPYLVLEYVPGESLDQLCEAVLDEERVVPPPIVVRMLADICGGLHVAHELRGEDGETLGLVHRDLSPQNILVNEEGRAVLIDFGIAKARERLTPETADGVMKGKIPYMAPEHAMGGEVDRRSDVWSLGAVGYLMLAGKEPHTGPNDAARLIRKLAGEPLAPLPEVVPAPVRAVIEKALATAPADRYPTAQALGEALEASITPATHEEVAKYFFDNLSHTARARRLIVEHAIQAADARARAREILSHTQHPTSVRHPSPSGADTTASVPAMSLEAGARPVFVYVGSALIALAIVLAYGIGHINGRGPVVAAGSAPSVSVTPPSASTSAEPVPLPSLLPLAPSVAPSASSPEVRDAGAASPAGPKLVPSGPRPPSTGRVIPRASGTPSAKPPEETIF